MQLLIISLSAVLVVEKVSILDKPVGLVLFVLVSHGFALLSQVMRIVPQTLIPSIPQDVHDHGVDTSIPLVLFMCFEETDHVILVTFVDRRDSIELLVIVLQFVLSVGKHDFLSPKSYWFIPQVQKLVD